MNLPFNFLKQVSHLFLSFLMTFSLALNVCAKELPDSPIVINDSQNGCVPKPEICGDAIDQDCNGSDKLCSGNDKDLDGFPVGQDCNDSNRFIYPGIYARCTASCGSGVQKCGANGAYESCSCKPLCEAKGTGRCYYVSKLTGNDTNPGTYEKPFKTYLNFLNYYTSKERPPGYVSLKAGDVVYFMSGTYDENITYQDRPKAFYVKYLNGTKEAPIVIKAYPGTHPILSSKVQTAALDLQQSTYILVEGFEVTKAYTDAIKIYDNKNIEIRNIWAHNNDGVDNSNSSAIELKYSHDIRIHHNILHDNYDRVAADTSGIKTENSRNIVVFGGSNLRIDHNIIFQSKPTSSKLTGACVAYKHSALLEGYENQISEIDHNILWNCFFNAIGSGSHRSRIHHNLIIDSGPIRMKDHGGTTHQKDNIIEYNTLVNSGAFLYNPTDTYSPIGNLTFRNNVILDKNKSADPTVNIYRYGPDRIYNKVVPTKLFSLSNNCYFNTEGSISFDLFSFNERGETLGGAYNFTQWQSLGYDTGSIIADPKLDSEYRPSNPNCLDKGHWAGW